MEPTCACKLLPSQRSAICRGTLRVWSPVSYTLDLGIFPGCNCNWFFKSTGKSSSVFEVKTAAFTTRKAFSRDTKHSRAQLCTARVSTMPVLCFRGYVQLWPLFFKWPIRVERRTVLYKGSYFELTMFWREEEMQWRIELGHNFRMPRFFFWFAYCFCKAASHI